MSENNGGTFTINIPRWETLPRRWWERLFRRPVRVKALPDHQTRPLSFDASAEDLQAALIAPGVSPIRALKNDDGTFVMSFMGADDEVSNGDDTSS